MDIAANYKPTWSSKRFSFKESDADVLLRTLADLEHSVSIFVEDLFKIVVLHPAIWQALSKRNQNYIRHPKITEPPYQTLMFFDVLGHLSSDRFFSVIDAVDKNDHFTKCIYKLSVSLRTIFEHETSSETVNNSASHKLLLSSLGIKRHQCPVYELIVCPPPNPSAFRNRWQLLVLSVLQANYLSVELHPKLTH